MKNAFKLSLLALLCIACAPKRPPALVQPEEAEPPPLEPLAPMELSLFDEQEAGCAWKRIRLPAAEVTTLAQFPSSCAGVNVAWSKDLKRALVSFNPNQLSTSFGSEKNNILQNANIGPLRAFEVDMETGNLAPLPPLKKLRGEFKLFGLTPEGVVALTLESLPPKQEQAVLQEIKKKSKKPFLLSGGGEKISIALPEEVVEGAGMPAVAHAWLLKGGAGKRVESKFTTIGFSYILDVRALDTYQQLGPMTERLLEAYNPLLKLEEPKEVEALSAWAPQAHDEKEHWGKQSTPQGELLGWVRYHEFGYASGLLLYQPKGKALSPLPGLGFGWEDLVAPAIRDAWLLVGTLDIGAWPRVYDLRNGELVWSSDSARAVVFWPE